MATVTGFKGIRYNPEKVSNFDDVLAPPYDVINKEQQQGFYDKDPYNVIRLILPQGDNDTKYEDAANSFRKWLDDNVLIQDDASSIYPYYQEFEDKGKKLTRKGFIAAVKIEDFETKQILPHEKTFPKHKQDRLKLTTACNANMSPVFSVYSDPEGTVESAIDERLNGEPIFSVTSEEGVVNKFWKISDASTLELVQNALKDKSLLIADGHHRYETSINYRNLRREQTNKSDGQPFEYVLMFLSRAEDEGLVINPTHRIIKTLRDMDLQTLLSKLEDKFYVEEMEFNKGVSDIGYDEFTIITASSDTSYRIKPKNGSAEDHNNLGVMNLHNYVLKDIIDPDTAGVMFTKYLDEAKTLVASGEYEIGFILPELRASDIVNTVSSGDRMPHKTTYFYPKILSGLVFNPLW